MRAPGCPDVEQEGLHKHFMSRLQRAGGRAVSAGAAETSVPTHTWLGRSWAPTLTTSATVTRACTRRTGREGATVNDRAHRRWACAQPGLASVYDGAGQRRPTFSVGGMGESPSMIDDTLVRAPAGAAPGARLVASSGIHMRA
jgi:hypothetical protein